MADDNSTFELRWPWSASATFVGLMWIIYAWSIWIAGGMSPSSGGMWIGSLTGMGNYVAGATNAYVIVHDHEWERCVSGIFLHGGFLHIILNSGAILQLGRVLEAFTTRGRCWFTLLLSGLVGSLAVVIWAQVTGTNVSAVGASGAGCGLGTALIVLSHGIDALAEFRKQMITWVVVMLVMGFIPFISATAHVGGAIGGAIAGLIIRRRGFVRMATDAYSNRLGGATKLLTLLFVAALVLNAWRATGRKAGVAELDEAANEVYSWLNAGQLPEVREWRAHLEQLDLPTPLDWERREMLELVGVLQRMNGGSVSEEVAEEARERLQDFRHR